MSPAGTCSEWERNAGAPASPFHLGSGRASPCSPRTPSWGGRSGRSRTSGQLLFREPLPSLRVHSDPVPLPSGPRFPDPCPPTAKQTPEPLPRCHSVQPRAGAPRPGGGAALLCVLCLTIVLCGLEHPTGCLCPTPAPARASLRPLPEPGSSPGLARRHRGHPHRRLETCTEWGWLCATVSWEAGVTATVSTPPTPPLSLGTSTRNCSNRPWLPPHCHSNGCARAAGRRKGLLGGRACGRAGSQRGIWLQAGRRRFSPTWVPHQGP